MPHLRTVFTILVVMLVAACADAPTAPESADTYASDAGALRSDYILDPVVVVGTPRCDPYLSLSWCQEDGGGGGDCMTGSPGDPTGEYTIASTCPGAGGGDLGPKPGGGGAFGPGAGTDADGDKYDEDLALNCPGCGERAPTADEKATMEGLLSEVTCSDGRSTLSAMLTAGSLQVYDDDNGLFGGWNSNTQTIYISRPKHWDATTGTVNGPELVDTLVHEVVHKLLGHVNGPQQHDQAWKDKMAACGFAQP